MFRLSDGNNTIFSLEENPIAAYNEFISLYHPAVETVSLDDTGLVFPVGWTIEQLSNKKEK